MRTEREREREGQRKLWHQWVPCTYLVLVASSSSSKWGRPQLTCRQFVRVLWSGLCDPAPQKCTIHQTHQKSCFLFGLKCGSVDEPHNPLTQLRHRWPFLPVNQCRGRSLVDDGPQPSYPGSTLVTYPVTQCWAVLSRGTYTHWLSARVYSHLPTGYQIRSIPTLPLSRPNYQSIQRTIFWYIPTLPLSRPNYQSIQRTSFGIYPWFSKATKKVQRTSQRIAGSFLVLSWNSPFL